MSATKAVFVLIHGGWHNHSSWDRVTPILKANGFAALTLDLPGAGVNAIAPTRRSVFARSTPLRSPPSGHPSPALPKRSGRKR
jgi:alpha-beta hydrolase superfamily lysophospholipase